MFADLPVGVENPLERLAAVAAQMDRLKGGGVSVSVDSMLAVADFVPPTLMALGATVDDRRPASGQHGDDQHPRPQYPLYLVGRRMLEMFPYIPIGQEIRISIGIVSYDGRLVDRRHG